MQAFEKDLKTIINYSKEHKLSQIPSSDLSIQEESINYLLNHGLIKVKVFDMIPWITVTLKGKSYFTDKKVKDSESRKYSTGSYNNDYHRNCASSYNYTHKLHFENLN